MNEDILRKPTLNSDRDVKPGEAFKKLRDRFTLKWVYSKSFQLPKAELYVCQKQSKATFVLMCEVCRSWRTLVRTVSIRF